MGTKRSVIWNIPTERLSVIVKKSKSMTEVMAHFGLKNIGSRNVIFRERLKKDNIDMSHFGGRSECIKNLKIRIPLHKILVKNSSYNRGHLKKRLIERGLLRNECYICGLKPNWYGKGLVMVLDHINGVNNDNRIENLRMLCPNCDSQQDTFKGKNAKRIKTRYCLGCYKRIHQKSKTGYCRKCLMNKKKKTPGQHKSKNDIFCNQCGSGISGWGKTGLCRKCAHIGIGRKTERPPTAILLSQIKQFGFCKTAKKYGVSDNAIRKWIKIKK